MRKDMVFVDYKDVVETLEKNPSKRLFWRFGWTHSGNAEEEISRDAKDYPYKRFALFHPGVIRQIKSWRDELAWRFEKVFLVERVSESETEIHLRGLKKRDFK